MGVRRWLAVIFVIVATGFGVGTALVLRDASKFGREALYQNCLRQMESRALLILGRQANGIKRLPPHVLSLYDCRPLLHGEQATKYGLQGPRTALRVLAEQEEVPKH